jgi:hypothetical protein
VSRELGARCDDSSECDDRCLLPEDGWPGGLCTQSCDDDTDCPDEAACVDDDDVCLYTCDEAADCAFLGTGWTCATRPGRPGPDGVMVCVGA